MKANLRNLLLGGVALLALGFAASARAQEIKIALDTPPDKQKSGSYVYAAELDEALKAAGFQTKMLPMNAIGGEAERLDQTAQGLLEVNLADLGRAGQLDKFAFGFSLAYLFDSMAQIDRANKEAGLLDKLNERLAPKGVRVVTLMAVGGAAGLFNTKREITKPEDVVGLRFRALDENQLRMISAWGANGVIITMPEVANALSSGIADGYINPPFVPFMFGHAEILKFYTQAAVSQSLRVAMVSEDWYKGLKADRRAAFDAAVAKAQAANRAWVDGSDPVAIEQLKKAGITVSQLTPEGRAKFKALSETVYTNILPAADVKIFVDAAAKTRQ